MLLIAAALINNRLHNNGLAVTAEGSKKETTQQNGSKVSQQKLAARVQHSN